MDNEQENMSPDQLKRVRRLGYSLMDTFVAANPQWREDVFLNPRDQTYAGMTLEASLAYMQWLVAIGVSDPTQSAELQKRFREAYGEGQIVPFHAPGQTPSDVGHPVED